MNTNFGVIFLCLLFGVVIGFEIGKYVMGKKISDLLTQFAEGMKKETEKSQREREEIRRKFSQAVDNLMKELLQAEEQAKKKNAMSVPDQETIDRIYEMEPIKEENAQ